jgi:hypothetical protein
VKDLEKLPLKLRISDLLRELHRLERIEDPKERTKEFAKFIPMLQDFAHRCEDRKLIETVRDLSISEEKARNFYRIEALRNDLKNLTNTIKETKDVISSDATDCFLHCIYQFEKALIAPKEQALTFVRVFSEMTKQLIYELIGRRLEKEIIPDLAMKIGYAIRPNIFSHNNSEIEVDFVGEKDLTTSSFGNGKLKKKEVLLVECKTTISESDINDFARKVAIIKGKYEISADAFQYDLKLDAWMVSCYGWTDELKDMAIKNGIKPFGKDELEDILEKHGILDHRIPTCP